jgi:hypothetical protein
MINQKYKFEHVNVEIGTKHDISWPFSPLLPGVAKVENLA